MLHARCVRAVVDAISDTRVALRQLARRPGFTLLAVATLALGIGAAVALSSVAIGLLVSPALVVKGDGAPPPLSAVRALIATLDARVATGRIGTLDAIVAAAVGEPLRLRFFLALLGALALVVGAIGIYSVVSYSVTRRRAEFGLRLALGAAPRRVLVEVVTSALAPVAVGVVAGLLAVAGLGPVAQRFLYGVDAGDPMSLAAAAAALIAASVGAAVVPALRAGRTDPMTALRAD